MVSMLSAIVLIVSRASMVLTAIGAIYAIGDCIDNYRSSWRYLLKLSPIAINIVADTCNPQEEKCSRNYFFIMYIGDWLICVLNLLRNIKNTVVSLRVKWAMSLH